MFVRPVWVIVRAVWRFWVGVDGDAGMDGSAGGGSGAGLGGGERMPVSTDPNIPRPEWAPDLSMYGDEYL